MGRRAVLRRLRRWMKLITAWQKLILLSLRSKQWILNATSNQPKVLQYPCGPWCFRVIRAGAQADKVGGRPMRLPLR